MAALKDILSPVWTLSLDGGGAIAEGMDAIRQCIDIIIRTTKGSDPLRPEFGCDVNKKIDHPLNVAIPNMKAAILDAIATWEPRVSITDISHTIVGAGNIIFGLTYTLADSSISDSVAFLISSGGVFNQTNKRRLILQGAIPGNPAGLQYQIFLALNNSDVLPSPPPNGFSTPGELYAWVQTNWGNFGQWYLTGSSIVGYIIPDFSQGTISVDLLVSSKYTGLLPGLPIGDTYSASIIVDGTTYSISGLLTPGQILQWAQNDKILGALGNWAIEVSDDSFSEDFNEDFDLYQLFLSVYANEKHTVSITITTSA